MWAARTRQPDVVKALLAAKADPSLLSASVPPRTALSVAVQFAGVKTVQLLLVYGVVVEESGGQPVVRRAVGRLHTKVFRAMMESTPLPREHCDLAALHLFLERESLKRTYTKMRGGKET